MVFMALDSEEEEEKQTFKARKSKRQPAKDVVGLSPMLTGRYNEDSSLMQQEQQLLAAYHADPISMFGTHQDETLNLLEESEVDRQQQRVVGMVAHRQNQGELRQRRFSF